MAGVRDTPLFSIGAIADPQYADQPDKGERRYRLTPAKLSAAIDALNDQELAFVVHLGDFIDQHAASYDMLLPIAARLRHRQYFVLGNHDFEIEDADKAGLPARLAMPGRYYSFAHGGWLFIVTDGNDLSSYAWAEGSEQQRLSLAIHSLLHADKPLWNGGIGDAQLDWIDGELARADAEGLRVMLLCHFPIWPENVHNLWNAPALIGLIERHASTAIWLSGHNHDGNYAERGGVHYVTLSAMLDTADTAFARLDFYPDRVELLGFGRQKDRLLRLREE